MSSNERLIYEVISKQEGVTKKDLARVTKLPANLLDKILKDLGSFNLIKKVKRPESKGLNVWVLFSTNVEEQQAVNLQHRDDLMNLVRRHGSTTLAELHKDATRKGLKVEHLQLIVNVLQMRGEIYIIGENIISRVNKQLPSVCLTCALRDVCSPQGVVNPLQCPFISW